MKVLCLMRRIIIPVLIVAVIAGAGLLAYNLIPGINPENRKVALVNTLFAPQLTQVGLITDQVTRQFEAYHAANEDVPAEKVEQARELILKAEDNMRDTVQNTLTETYTLEELQEKKEFENSELAVELAAKETEVLQLMHIIGKKLGREAILRSVDKEFEAEEAQALRGVVRDLASNVQMPNTQRAELIAEKMDMVQEQAQVMLSLLSVRKEDAVKEQLVLDYSRQDIPQEKIELAKEYTNLTQLDSVFGETVQDMVEEANLEEAYQEARKQLVAGVAHLYSEETLETANDYFARDIAQRVLEKDMQVAQKLSPRIREQMQNLNTELTQLVEGS